ncbi:MAG TPA: gamma-glutamyl-gamma-aminobutyrate hydrolase family protein [Gaiellales bacterium]|nr:gamma-glutamyl-gamma-aminobutyrate hydrolase family protein [Gaiellales bacterium]
MRRRPVIGYTIEIEDPMLREVEPGLREPLEQLGATAIVLPRSTPVDRIDDLLGMVDGVQLCGGADVDPSRYGHERHPLTKPFRPDQDAFEIEITRRALDRGMPVFGICRGIQVLAVADGGTLTQDVETMHPEALPHRQPWVELAMHPPGDHWHDVEVRPGSAAEGWFAGGPARVNSFHHQCVAELGPRLVPTVRARDGVIETLERTDGRGYAAGVQWHNELMWRGDDRFLRPFVDLVGAARDYAFIRSAAAVRASR